MRKLTLHEKITFKGVLNKRGIYPSVLVKLSMKSLIHYWRMAYGPYKPLHDCFKRKKL
jgi:hypothetical protein